MTEIFLTIGILAIIVGLYLQLRSTTRYQALLKSASPLSDETQKAKLSYRRHRLGVLLIQLFGIAMLILALCL